LESDDEKTEKINRERSEGQDGAINPFRRRQRSRAWVAHACNPSYSGDRDQEDQGSKPAQANRPYLENTQHNHLE
jgi:hypothetical protein